MKEQNEYMKRIQTETREEYVKKLYRQFPAKRIADILSIKVDEVEAIARRLGLKKR